MTAKADPSGKVDIFKFVESNSSKEAGSAAESVIQMPYAVRMRDRKARLVCTAGLLSLAVNALAQPPPLEDVQTIIRLSQAQLASYGSWHADVVLVEVQGDQELRYKGTVD